MNRNDKKRKNNSVRSFERLENRNMMAGDVTVTLVSGDLVVNGDAAANMLQITETSGNRFKITGLAGTTINGQAKFTTGPVTGDVEINLGEGDDHVLVKSATVDGALNVSGDNGNNTITLKNVNAGAGLGVYGNDGNDLVVADKVGLQSVNGNFALEFSLGNGSNTLIANKLTGRDVRVYTGNGTDSVAITNSSLGVGSTLTLNTGDNRDMVALSKVTTTTLSVDVGGGNMDSVVSQKSTADTASFDDTSGTNGIIAGLRNKFRSLTIDPNFVYRSGDLQQDTVI